MDEEQKVFYEDKAKRIRFIPNPRDGPSAYDVLIGDGRFYLHDRVLPDLAMRTTQGLREGLEAMDSMIPHILEDNHLTYEQLHLTLLQLRVKEVEAFSNSVLTQLSERD